MPPVPLQLLKLARLQDGKDTLKVSSVGERSLAMVFTKEKDTEVGEIKEGYVDILGHVDIKKDEPFEGYG